MITNSKSRILFGWKWLPTAAAAFLWMLAHFCSASDNKPDELQLAVVLTTGERSKDSSSKTTTITVKREAIIWERTSTGRGSRNVPPVRKEFLLPNADKKELLQVIRDNHLFVTDAIALPQGMPNVYFRLAIDVTFGEEKGTIAISGPRKAATIMEKPLYQNAQVLVKELYRIMQAQDKSVRFEELVRP